MSVIDVMVIVLLIVSAICLVISFLIPDRKAEESGIDQELAAKEVSEMIEKEKEAQRESMQEMASQYVGYAFEGAVTKFEEMANGKTTEFTDYSDAVRGQIKTEEEDLLLLHQSVREEHEGLKNTVMQAGKAAKTMKESIEKVNSMRPIAVSYGKGSVKIAPMAHKVKDEHEKG